MSRGDLLLYGGGAALFLLLLIAALLHDITKKADKVIEELRYGNRAGHEADFYRTIYAGIDSPAVGAESAEIQPVEKPE